MFLMVCLHLYFHRETTKRFGLADAVFNALAQCFHKKPCQIKVRIVLLNTFIGWFCGCLLPNKFCGAIIVGGGDGARLFY